MERIELNRVKNVSLSVKFSICVLLNGLQTSPEDSKTTFYGLIICFR